MTLKVVPPAPTNKRIPYGHPSNAPHVHHTLSPSEKVLAKPLLSQGKVAYKSHIKIQEQAMKKYFLLVKPNTFFNQIKAGDLLILMQERKTNRENPCCTKTKI